MADMSMEFTIKSNLAEIKSDFKQALEKSLTEWGILAQGYATEEVPVDTSNLKNSIAFKTNVDEGQMVVGTNVKYAPYVEFGTGLYTENSQAKKIPWSYQDEEGKWHTTSGMQPHPYLKPSLENHVDEYKAILRDNLIGD